MEKLPNEIQQLVFKDLRDNIEDILECVLVCKNWRNVYQKLLYFNVQLSTFSQLTNFVDTLEKNQHLGCFVIKLTLQLHQGRRSLDQFSIIDKLFAPLTNLEYIDCSHYSILLDALMSNQMPKLTFIKPPSGRGKSVGEYAACAIFLKDRLKNLSIMDANEDEKIKYEDDEISNEQSEKYSVQYYRLNNRLGQFKNIRELFIEKETIGAIDFLEEISKICPTLRQLNMCVNRNKNKLVDINDDIISNVTPESSIVHLTLEGEIFYNTKILSYIIKKYPQPTTLVIKHYRYHSWFDSESEYIFNKLTFNKLMDYLMKIRFAEFTDIICEKNTLMDSIERFWLALSQSRLLSVHLGYIGRALSSPNHYKMHVEMKDGLSNSSIFSRPGIHFPHKTVLETYGYLIDHLSLSISAPTDDQKDALFELFFLHPFKHCSKLKQLIIYGNKFGPSRNFNALDFGKKKLDVLRFTNCHVLSKEIVFKRVSSVFSYLKNLEFIGIEPVSRPKPLDRSIEIRTIEMVETDIGTLTISKKPLKYDSDKSLVLLRIWTEFSSGFYNYDFSTMRDYLFKPVEESYYRKHYDRSTSFVIGFKCKSVKSIRVTHLTKVIRLEIP